MSDADAKTQGAAAPVLSLPLNTASYSSALEDRLRYLTAVTGMLSFDLCSQMEGEDCASQGIRVDLSGLVDLLARECQDLYSLAYKEHAAALAA